MREYPSFLPAFFTIKGANVKNPFLQAVLEEGIAFMCDEISEVLFQSASTVSDYYIVNLGTSAKLVFEIFFGFLYKGTVEFVFY